MIKTEPSTRVLGVEVNKALSKTPHLKRYKEKFKTQRLALERIIKST